MTPPTTDERLRNFLDTYQLARERLPADLLAIDRRFSGVKPRHPHGGPDGGVDIDATFEGRVASVAVGFVNGAKDSDAEKNQIKKKYREDAKSSAGKSPRPEVFVFFTNINLTLGEKDDLKKESAALGIPDLEIYDRERMRVLLDSPDGLGIRFRHLQMPLSDAEQAAFFSRWGDDIQQVIGSRLSQIDLSLARIQFLHEATAPLSDFSVTAELDREYSAAEIGHFRFFCNIHLKEPKDKIFWLKFGATDNSDRVETDRRLRLGKDPGGIGKSMCGGSWIVNTVKRKTSKGKALKKAEKEQKPKYSHKKLNAFTSVGRQTVRLLTISFGFGSFIRLPPYLTLRDMDGCYFALLTNSSFATKIKAIHVTGNDYKLAEFSGKQFRSGDPLKDPDIPMRFSKEEIKDPWTRIMAAIGPFKIDFSDSTPCRMFSADLVADSLHEARKKQMEAYKKQMAELP